MMKAARRIVERLRQHGHEALFAGGWVRDYLLGRKPKDIDIATSALPTDVLRLFPRSRPIGAQFGVVQVPMYRHVYEVATFRSDSAYVDGRHPVSVTFSDAEQDALRRDFTINGLFYDPVDNRVIDYVRGRDDLDARLIRTIGDPGERFSEDKLRILRAIRLSCTLGFSIVPETWNAIHKLAPDILQVSWERIRDELTKIFTGPAPDKGLDRLQVSGILKYILPEVEDLRGVPQSFQRQPNADVFDHTRDALALLKNPSPALAFAALLHDTGKPRAIASANPESLQRHADAGAKVAEEICRRLRMSNDEIGRIVDLVSMHSQFAKVKQMRESDVKRLLRRPDIAEHLELHRVDRLGGQKDLDTYFYWVQKLNQFKQQPIPDPLLKGEDLIHMGYTPGPVFKDILRSVEDLQLEGSLRTREEAIAHVRTAFPLSIETD